jgi:tRNA A37 threonylcarbamoyladenosine dehydratase
MTNYEARFSGIRRLYGADGQDRLARAHVCVVGIGGVGSWVVEALARTGLGALTLVDLDDVCISNVNRQLHAVTGAFGRPKVEAMADRVRLIQPDCRINAVQSLFTATTAAEILATQYDGVVDAIDQTPMKALLIARCRALGRPIVTTGGAGGRRDPTALRDEHGFPRDPKAAFGVDCVYSTEAQVYPAADGSVCETREPGANLRLDCRSGYGTACFLTGAFGFAAAAQMVKHITTRETT